MARRTLKILLFLFFVWLFLGGFFCWQKFCQADESNVIINEIQISGGNGKTTEDYIELYNKSSKPIKISGWKLRKRTQSGTESSIKALSASATIPSKGYFLWSNSSIAEKIKADESTSSIISANNSLALLDDNEKIVDQVAWGAGHINPFIEDTAIIISDGQPERIERKNFQDTGNNSEDFRILSDASPTPSGCLENPEKCSLDDDEIENLSDAILITELLPNPSSDKEEYIEIYNGGKDLLNLKDWELHDATKTGTYTFTSDENIDTKKYLAIYKTKYKFALNNSGNEKISLLDPSGKEVSFVEYNGSKENVSYNFDGQRWRWSKFLTPGKKNIFNNEPYGTVKIDDDIYVNVYADFAVSTGDGDGEKVKVVWNFGDEHKSYLAKTRHKYTAEGKYLGSVKLSDGSEDVTKDFTVDVKEIPKPKVRIISVNPNPKGADDAESITLLNKSKRKINLNGWSIATGWKKLYNHPITQDFEIKAGKEKIVTKEFSKFTLSNTKTKIELRYPDEEVAHKIKYKKDKIADDETYAKIDSAWQWTVGAKTEDDATNTPESNPEPVPEEEVVSEPQSPIEEITPEIIGKLSALKNKRPDIEIKILGFKKTKTNLPLTLQYASNQEPFVLGISNARVNSLASGPIQKTKIEKYFFKINLSLNNLISRFFN